MNVTYNDKLNPKKCNRVYQSRAVPGAAPGAGSPRPQGPAVPSTPGPGLRGMPSPPPSLPPCPPGPGLPKQPGGFPPHGGSRSWPGGDRPRRAQSRPVSSIDPAPPFPQAVIAPPLRGTRGVPTPLTRPRRALLGPGEGGRRLRSEAAPGQRSSPKGRISRRPRVAGTARTGSCAGGAGTGRRVSLHLQPGRASRSGGGGIGACGGRERRGRIEGAGWDWAGRRWAGSEEGTGRDGDGVGPD